LSKYRDTSRAQSRKPSDLLLIIFDEFSPILKFSSKITCKLKNLLTHSVSLMILNNQQSIAEFQLFQVLMMFLFDMQVGLGILTQLSNY
jgi:hypothetical protein